MREIKFRGKSLDNGKWVVGYLVYVTGKPHVIPNPVLGGWHKHCVDPETVGQYTGLKDKVGKEIYENDIIKDWNGIRSVKFEIYDNRQGYEIELDDSDLEVIGNIHENPELLKGGEE